MINFTMIAAVESPVTVTVSALLRGNCVGLRVLMEELTTQYIYIYTHTYMILNQDRSFIDNLCKYYNAYTSRTVIDFAHLCTGEKGKEGLRRSKKMSG